MHAFILRVSEEELDCFCLVLFISCFGVPVCCALFCCVAMCMDGWMDGGIHTHDSENLSVVRSAASLGWMDGVADGCWLYGMLWMRMFVGWFLSLFWFGGVAARGV